ncbi:MAG: type II secretion system protein [Prochlorococcaceae cyanobacterium]|jgi:prepilin-type N-terminal cleavage/methylation domain-containing protein
MVRRTGFTLVELLITAVIGGMLLAMGAQVITTHIRITGRQEALQRLRDHWGLVSHLINTEALEGSVIQRNQTMANCEGGGTSILTIQLSDANQPPIHYYQAANTDDLWRCGPEIQRNGHLNPNTIVSGLVAPNATLSIPVSEPDAGDHELAYELTLTSRNNQQGETYAGRSMARTSGRTYSSHTR